MTPLGEEPVEKLERTVRTLLNQGRELEWIEYKQNKADPEDVGEYISALANTATLCDRQDAYMVWGIEDGTLEIVGTSFRPFTAKKGNQDLVPWLVQLLNPQIHFEFAEVEVDGHPLVILKIAAAEHSPIAFQGRKYVRIGPHKKPLDKHPNHERRLWRALERRGFEHGVLVEDVSLDDALELIDYASYFSLLGQPLPEKRAGVAEVLSADGILRPNDSGFWSITSLGAILFAKSIEDFPAIQRKAIRVIEYDGDTRMRTKREQVGAKGYASGFEGLVGFINAMLPANEVIGEALRRSVPVYPTLAVRELVANALIHQDFTLTGTGPTVEIFDSRLEITNPGRPLQDPRRFIDLPPLSRNETLAAMMRRTGICEERGSGWDKVAFEIELNQLPAPHIGVSESHTKVTLFSPKPLNSMDRDERVRAVYLHACLRYVNSQKTTNSSIRERFSIDKRNSATATRLLSDALDAGVIAPYDPDAGRRFMSYQPYWVEAGTLAAL